MPGMLLTSWPRQAAMMSMPLSGSASYDYTGRRYALREANETQHSIEEKGERVWKKGHID